jgi:glucose/mannose-6-phosphate isomerase
MHLNNLRVIKRLDKKNVAESIFNLPLQIETAYLLAKKQKLPADYGKVKNIVFCGMGGSNLASELIRDLFSSQIKIPFVLVRNYNLPAFVNKESLIIISSYSGNTTETVSCLEQALKKKAKIITLSAGGKIKEIANNKSLIHFEISKEYNPSGQPRYGLGMQFGISLAIFENLKIIKINPKELKLTLKKLLAFNYLLIPGAKINNNPAKKSALKLRNRNIYLIAGEHLSSVAHILANQINESGKQLASPYKIPEFNHHFLEALVHPKKIITESTFVFLYSDNYSLEIKKRFIATKKILDTKKILNLTLKPPADETLSETLKALSLGGWLSFYLAMLNDCDPADIYWVETFKKQL